MLSVVTALWFGLTAPSLSPVAAPAVPLTTSVSTTVVPTGQARARAPVTRWPRHRARGRRRWRTGRSAKSRPRLSAPPTSSRPSCPACSAWGCDRCFTPCWAACRCTCRCWCPPLRDARRLRRSRPGWADVTRTGPGTDRRRGPALRWHNAGGRAVVLLVLLHAWGAVQSWANAPGRRIYRRRGKGARRAARRVRPVLPLAGCHTRSACTRNGPSHDLAWTLLSSLCPDRPRHTWAEASRRGHSAGTARPQPPPHQEAQGRDQSQHVDKR